MASDLKPCPFCGGEAELVFFGGAYCAISCQTCNCRTDAMDFDDAVRAFETWNRRAERTCRMDVDEWRNTVRCTACGHEECNPCSNGCMYGNAKFRWRFCPNCGAKVAEES